MRNDSPGSEVTHELKTERTNQAEYETQCTNVQTCKLVFLRFIHGPETVIIGKNLRNTQDTGFKSKTTQVLTFGRMCI